MFAKIRNPHLMNLTLKLSTDQPGTTSHITKHGEDTQPECHNILHMTLSY
jgi:hypothetical protein